MAQQRLQKILSAAGLCSRRTAELWLADGRVTVNGVAAAVGDQADPAQDAIAVDGKPIGAAPAPLWLMLHKPRGVVTTLSDERGRATVAGLVADCGARVWPVGRLDYDSEGLLLLTNDGAMTNRLTHPRYEVEKEYQVWVRGDAAHALPLLRAPMVLEGETMGPAEARVTGREGVLTLLSVVIRQGKNRQVRRMCEHAGLEVVRLKRVREGALCLDPALAPGRWRVLTEGERALLRQD